MPLTDIVTDKSALPSNICPQPEINLMLATTATMSLGNE